MATRPKFARCGAIASLIGAAILCAPAALAVDNNWIGGAGNWSAAANWSLGHPPLSTEVASISDSTVGVDTVTLDISATVAGLKLGSTVPGAPSRNLLMNAGRTLTLNGPGNVVGSGTLTLSSGTLTGSGVLTIDSAMNWSFGDGTIVPYVVTTDGRSGDAQIRFAP